VWTTLSSFVPMWPGGITKGGPEDALLQHPRDHPRLDKRFDVVLALFGAGASLSETEPERMTMLLSTGGRAWVTFEEDNEAASQWLSLHSRAGEVCRIGHYSLCCYEKSNGSR
jgi:hypothetical protein